MDKPETEILVHIAAPAMAADDARYRALASAYLSFDPATRTPIVSDAAEDTGTKFGYGHYEVEAEPAPRPTQDAWVIDSPMLSFRSVVNNLNSPRLRHAAGHGMAESQSSFEPPPSVIEDSMPDNDFGLAQYCTPTRILEHYTSTLGATQSVSPSQRRQSQTLPVSSQPRTRSPGWQSSQDDGAQRQQSGPDTVIPQSPSECRKRPLAETPTLSAIIEETRIGSSYPSQRDSQRDEQPSSFRAESEPPLPKRPRITRHPEPGKPLARSASDTGPRRANTQAPHHHQLPDTLEILSPPPTTAQRNLQPSDLITDVLGSLARELNLAKRYQPASQTRALRPFERGHWLVDCTGWEPELKRSAWGFLTDYLGKGAAGWGTSCRRDREFTHIRVYCFGCVVGHMYLVLYLMSKRRVLYTGATWVGGDGRDVVVMGTRPAAAV